MLVDNTKIKKIEELNKKITQLNTELSKVIDTDKKYEIEHKIIKLKDEMYTLIREKKKQTNHIFLKDLLKKEFPKPIYYQTGIKAIDDNISGFPKGAFIQLAAASGVGKTTLMMKFMVGVAINKKVVHFDFEMGDYKFQMNVKKFLNAYSEKEKNKIIENYMIDFVSYNLDDLVREIEFHSYNGVDFFTIDSKMKIVVNGAREGVEKDSKISAVLSRLTRENGITIVMINQMSEASQKDGLPTLKGSGDQMYDSDVALFLFKKKKKKEETSQDEVDEYHTDRRVLYVRKNRFGREDVIDEIFYTDIHPNNKVIPKIITVKEEEIQGINVKSVEYVSEQEMVTQPKEEQVDYNDNVPDVVECPFIDMGEDEDDNASCPF